MKIPANSKVGVGTDYELARDAELAELAAQYDAAFSGLEHAVQATLSAPVQVRPQRRKDAYVGPRPKGQVGEEPSVSSVAPRARAGDGVPVHQLLSSAGPLGAIATISGHDHLFAWDAEADTSIDQVSTRKLLGFYEDSMSALHGSLKTFDHDRKEGLWYERYREDLWQELDRDAEYYRSFDQYSNDRHYADLEADRMALEHQLQVQSWGDYDDPYR